MHPQTQLQYECIDPSTLGLVGSPGMNGLNKRIDQRFGDIGRPPCNGSTQYSNLQPDTAREDMFEGVLLVGR